MKRIILIILAFGLFLSGCGAVGDLAAPAETATATINPTEVKATAEAMVYLMLTETAAAMPSPTPLPPTETPLPPTAAATATIMAPPTLAEPTADSASAPAATAEVLASPTTAIIPTNTLVASSSSSAFACTEKPLTSWDEPSITVHVSNTVKDTTGYVFLCIVTQNGQAGYITIPAGSSAQVPYGFVTATAWVSGAKNFNDTIFFDVKTPDGREIVIENGRIFYRGSCYPNC